MIIPHAWNLNIVSLDEEEVQSIAHLARLGLKPDEIAPLASELSSLLDLVEQLNGANTDGVEPLAHPGVAELRLRDDVVSEPNDRDNLQKPAPATADGYFLVPRVIE